MIPPVANDPVPGGGEAGQVIGLGGAGHRREGGHDVAERAQLAEGIQARGVGPKQRLGKANDIDDRGAFHITTHVAGTTLWRIFARTNKPANRSAILGPAPAVASQSTRTMPASKPATPRGMPSLEPIQAWPRHQPTQAAKTTPGMQRVASVTSPVSNAIRPGASNRAVGQRWIAPGLLSRRARQLRPAT